MANKQHSPSLLTLSSRMTADANCRLSQVGKLSGKGIPPALLVKNSKAMATASTISAASAEPPRLSAGTRDERKHGLVWTEMGGCLSVGK